MSVQLETLDKEGWYRNAIAALASMRQQIDGASHPVCI